MHRNQIAPSKMVKSLIYDVSYSKVLYMSSSFRLFRVESRDFPLDEKERTACKAEQIHKMTTVFTQNGPMLSF